MLVMIRRYSEAMRQRLMDALGFLSEHHLDRASRFLQALVQGAESTRSTKSILLLLLYTLLEWALIVGCYLCITHGVRDGARISASADVVIFIGFVSFGAVVQIPGIGGGVQVVAVLVLTKIFGVSVELATSIAVLIWLITFVVIVPFGLAAALHEGLSWRKLRELEREARTVNCPFCGHLQDKVVDSRESKEGDAIRRRRAVPLLRTALYHLRAHRRSALHGDQEGRAPGEIRSSEGSGRTAESLRKEAG